MDEHEMNWELDLLTAHAASFEYPVTPSFRAAMPSGAETGPGQGFGPARRWGFAAAAIAVVAASVALALPGPRDAVAGWLGLRVEGVVIDRLPPGIDQLPDPVAVQEFATITDLEGAAELLGFEPVLVNGLGAPRSVLVVDYDGNTFAVLVYEDFDLWQSDGGGYFAKGLPPGTVLEALTINGFPAYWMQGGPHLVTFYGDDGEPVTGSIRTVLRNTLLLRTDRLFYRIETELGLEQATTIAASLP